MNLECIKRLMYKREISIYKLSKMTLISESHLGKLINGKIDNPRIKTVKAIAKALGVDINEII